MDLLANADEDNKKIQKILDSIKDDNKNLQKVLDCLADDTQRLEAFMKEVLENDRQRIQDLLNT